MQRERADGEKHRERGVEWRGNEKDAHAHDEKTKNGTMSSSAGYKASSCALTTQVTHGFGYPQRRPGPVAVAVATAIRSVATLSGRSQSCG